MKKRSGVEELAHVETPLDSEAELAAAMVEVLEARKLLAAAEAKVKKLMRKVGPQIVTRVKKRIRY